jgi:hypothetical protein
MTRNSSQPAPSAKPSTTSSPPRSSAAVFTPPSGTHSKRRNATSPAAPVLKPRFGPALGWQPAFMTGPSPRATTSLSGPRLGADGGMSSNGQLSRTCARPASVTSNVGGSSTPDVGAMRTRSPRRSTSSATSTSSGAAPGISNASASRSSGRPRARSRRTANCISRATSSTAACCHVPAMLAERDAILPCDHRQRPSIETRDRGRDRPPPAGSGRRWRLRGLLERSASARRVPGRPGRQEAPASAAAAPLDPCSVRDRRRLEGFGPSRELAPDRARIARHLPGECHGEPNWSPFPSSPGQRSPGPPSLAAGPP